MSANLKSQCKTTILGPRMGRNVVAWRRRCGNRTDDPSGYCHVHRLVDGRGINKTGPGATR